MRHLIDLIEDIVQESAEPVGDKLFNAVQAIARQSFGHEFEQVPDEARAWYGSDNLREVMAIILDDLERLFAGRQAVLHRVLNLPDAVMDAFKAGDSLGPLDQNKLASWTEDTGSMSMDGLHIYAHHRETNLFVITARVPREALDVATTVAHRLEYQWEHEITLRRGHPVQVLSIQRCDMEGDEEGQVRADLCGKLLRT